MEVHDSQTRSMKARDDRGLLTNKLFVFIEGSTLNEQVPSHECHSKREILKSPLTASFWTLPHISKN